MERTQYDWQHQYLLTPQEYPISANENHSTYDQFIQLRDTLIFTWKYYNDKASRKLCVGDKWDWSTTNTIEVWLPNFFRQSIEYDWNTLDVTNRFLPKPNGGYITEVPSDMKAADQRFTELSCMINKDWHYLIRHKEEILPDASTEKVFCYVDVYRQDPNSQHTNKYEIATLWGIAVYDLESASGADYTIWDLYKKLTAMWRIETDLFKWDILAFRFQDWTYDTTTWEPTWNMLTLQEFSNYWSIEYIDLPYNI